MRIIAVDLGSRHVGIASCDEMEMIVTPLESVERKSNKQIVEEIISKAAKIGAAEIVVGHPLNMDGSAGRAAADAEKIAACLALSGISVSLWDERLSTWEAENILNEIGVKNKKRKSLIHSAAAAVILRSYLDGRKIPE